MKTTIEQSKGKAFVTFEGMLDSYIAEQVGTELEPLYELENTEITLDCTKLDYIASSGLRLISSRSRCTSGTRYWTRTAGRKGMT